MKRLSSPPFACLITEGEANPDNYLSQKNRIIETVVSACADGVDIIQIREKLLPARLLYDLVREAVSAARDGSTLITVNERADVAIAAGADGVHLPESGLPPRSVRGAFGDRLVIGVSTHSSTAANAAGDADYVFFGPVFPTPGKGEPTGIAALADVSGEVAIPVIALGGIDEGNTPSVLQAGASGIAAIRALNDPMQRARVLAAVRSGPVR